jgi:hypothetical protein
MVSIYIIAKITSLNSIFIKMLTSSWYSNAPYLGRFFNTSLKNHLEKLER